MVTLAGCILGRGDGHGHAGELLRNFQLVVEIVRA